MSMNSIEEGNTLAEANTQVEGFFGVFEKESKIGRLLFDPENLIYTSEGGRVKELFGKNGGLFKTVVDNDLNFVFMTADTGFPEGRQYIGYVALTLEPARVINIVTSDAAYTGSHEVILKKKL